MKKTPAEIVIQAFGGVLATAQTLGRSRAAVYLWLKPKNEGGTGGGIPASLQETILSKASKRGLALTPTDLILGK